MSSITPVIVALRWEWFRLSRRVGFWVIMALTGLLVVGALSITLLLQSLAPDWFRLPGYGFPLLMFEVLSRAGPFLGVILAALVFGGDFGWGAWRALLARGQARWQPALAKLLLSASILAAVWIIAWTLAAIVGLAAGDSSIVAGFIIELSGGWSETAVRFFSALPVALAYVALAAVLCVAGRSTALAVGAGLAIAIIEPVVYPLADVIAEAVSNVSLNEYTRWTLHGVAQGFTGQDESWGVWPFAPALLAYITALWGLTLLILTRADLKD